MKATNKRLVSILLVLAMVLAVLPMAVFAAGTTIYCDAPDSWTACYVHYWGGASSSTWPGDAMTLGEDGIWYAEVPSDSTGIIFNNGNGTQTSDMVFPTDENVQYNYEAGSWSTYGAEVEVVVRYYVAGSADLCNGAEWDPSAEANQMTEQADGTYAITYTDVAAGSYEFKVTNGTWDKSWGDGSANYALTLSETTDVTIIFDPATETITVESGAIVEPEPDPEPEPETVYYLRGDMNSWGLDHPMTNNGDGIYTVTISMTAGTYEYKAAVEDWTWAVPEGGNLTLVLAEDADVTFTLNTNDYTLTNDAPVVEIPIEPVVFGYYVAGSAGLCGVEWDPASNQMTLDETTGLYSITLAVWDAGTYEYKITTGSWETPSYGYGEGNYTVVVKNPGYVTITFNAETTEVTCDVYEFGEAELKFQLNADASADDATVDLRMITYVETLDFSMVQFKITINGEAAWVDCEVVYEAINANGASLTCADIFGREGYLVTFTMTDIPAEYYGVDIQVQAEYHPLEGILYDSSVRTIVLSDVLA